MGVSLPVGNPLILTESFPHIRGGEPWLSEINIGVYVLFPLTRGDTPTRVYVGHVNTNFSLYIMEGCLSIQICL